MLSSVEVGIVISVAVICCCCCCCCVGSVFGMLLLLPKSREWKKSGKLIGRPVFGRSFGFMESGGSEGGVAVVLGNERETACFIKLRRYASCSFINLFSDAKISIFAVTLVVVSEWT